MQISPTYYLHLNYPANFVMDDEGVELPDLEAAKQAARESIVDVASECLRARREFTLQSFKICDEEERLLAEVFPVESLGRLIPLDAVNPNASEPDYSM